MTENNSSEEQVVGSVAAVLKPDISGVDKEHIAALLKAQLDTQNDIEIFDIRGGSEKAGVSSGISVFTARIGSAVKDYVLRFAPYDNEHRLFAEYDIEGQFHIQRLLNGAGLHVPKPLCYETTCEYLPQPGFIMERIDGEVADANAYASGFFCEATDDQRSHMHDEILCALGDIHSVDWQALGLEAHIMQGSGRTYIERLLNWYWKTVEWAGLSCRDRLRPIRQWLIDNQPTYHRDDWSLAHGDTNVANYMFKDSKLVAVLDWEMAGIVHPSFDIASQCSYNEYCRLASPPEVQKIIPAEDELRARYEKLVGRRLVDFDYFRKLAAFPGLVTIASMARGMPEEHQEANARLAEPMWAVAESTN